MVDLLDVADLIELEVPVGGRVLVVSDIRLTDHESPTANTDGLREAIKAATGPGVLVFAGNLFDSGADADRALAAHAGLVSEVRSYASGIGRRVLVLPGDRDAALTWSEPARVSVCVALGAEVALAADLGFATASGRRLVRVEPGHRLDPLASFVDPHNPRESPFAQHIRDEMLPSVRKRQAPASGRRASWMDGMEQLDDPAALSRFIASRIVYRRLLRVAWVLVIPVVVAFVLRLPSRALVSARHGALAGRVGIFAAAAVVEIALLFLIALAAVRITYRSLAAIALDEERADRNETSRSSARDLLTRGYAGLVTGHTCRPELTHFGNGFYANAGACSEVVAEHDTAIPGLGLPTVFLGVSLVAWVELEGGSDLHVRLMLARDQLRGATLLERVLVRRATPSHGTSAEVVAAFPGGQSWPPSPSSEVRDRRIRRVTATMVVAVGFLTLVSAMSEPLRDRLHVLEHVFPVQIPETAAALAALAGLALIMLGRGIRRGQRRAWVVTEVVLVAAAIFHLAKGVDVEEAAILLGVAGLLWVNRSSFTARSEVARTGRGVVAVLVAGILAALAGTVAVEISSAIDHSRRPGQGRIAWPHAFEATVERMVGITSIAIPDRVADFLTPAMATVSAALVLALLAVLFRPVVTRRAHDEPEKDMERARAVVARHGAGTLDYFALRPDKEFFFWGDTVVAYGVYGGVCMVSPDPIGPASEREGAWYAFRRFADGQGWILGGLGAGEDWLPTYRSTGMHDLYLGDEAVVRVSRFSLEGGRFKGLRQAVNRVAKHGYRITFHDPAYLDPTLESQLRQVMTKSRRGDVERGFSMTLGRVFDRSDPGLLLAVVHGPVDDEPVAFCQYVPAPGIGGYSLDLMRRDDGDHPNGLMDFAIVETVKELKSRGMDGLGLNFATMRAVLAGEAGEGVSQKLQGWVLRRMSDSMQIESLWRFNAKFDPDWQPRYAMYDAPENLPAVAIAVARAESFWELPVIGRFLVPASETS